MRRLTAFLFLCMFATASFLKIGYSTGYCGLFAASAGLTYTGTMPQRQFNEARSFTRLAGQQHRLFLGVKLWRLTAGAVAVWSHYEPFYDSSFEVANTELGVAVAVPGVGLKGWRYGVAADLAVFSGKKWALELAGEYLPLRSMKTTAYTEEPFRAVITESPWGGYVFRLVVDDYSHRDAGPGSSWAAGVQFRYRLWKGLFSGWLSLQLGYEQLEWKLLYYRARNSGGFVRAGLWLR